MENNGDDKQNKKSCGRIIFISMLILFFLIILIGMIDRLMVSRGEQEDLKIGDCQKSYQIGDGHIDAALAISDDGDRLAALDSENIYIIESQTGQILAESTLHFDIARVSISSNGKLAVGIHRGSMGGPDYLDYSGDEIFILDSENRETIIVGEDEGFDIHSYYNFAPNSNDFLFTATIDEITGIFKLDLSTHSSEFLLEAYGPLFFSADGKVMGTGGLEGIQLWNYQDGSLSLIQEIPIPAPVWSAAMSPDGNKLAIATAYSEDPDFSRKVSIWDLPSGEYNRTIYKNFYASFTPSLSFSQDSELLAVVECEGKLFKVSDGSVLKDIDKIGTDRGNWSTGGCISDVVFSPEGDVYYYGSIKHLAECQVPPH